jgi:hypothetical protein
MDGSTYGESLLNVVTNDKPKRLNHRKIGWLEPKGKWPGRGAIFSLRIDERATGE